MGRSGGGMGGGGFSGGFSGGRVGGGFSGGGGRSGAPRFGGHPGGSYVGPGYSGGNGFLGGLILGNLLGSSRSQGGGSYPSGAPNGSGGSGGPGGNGGPGGRGSGNSSGSGCASVVVVIFVAVLLVVILSAALNFSSCSASGIGESSTIERTALPAGSVTETAYFTDEGGWISEPSVLEGGMRDFYKDTGVQPYLYILPNGQVTSSSELASMAESLYDELFSDEAHFLVVFCDNDRGSYNVGYQIGSLAASVLDSEAIRIFQAYLSQNYNDYGISESQLFANTYRESGDRIMVTDAERTTPIYITVAIIAGVVVIALIVLVIVRKRASARAAEQKRIQDILDTPLEKFGDADLEERAKKYEQNSESAQGVDDMGGDLLGQSEALNTENDVSRN